MYAPQEISHNLTLDALLEMNEAEVKETLRHCRAGPEDCGRLQQALACLRKVTGLGEWGQLASPAPAYGGDSGEGREVYLSPGPACSLGLEPCLGGGWGGARVT